MKDDIRPPYDLQQTDDEVAKQEPIDVVDSPVEASEQADLDDKQGVSDGIFLNESGGVGDTDKVPKKPIKHRITEMGMKLWPESKKARVIGLCIIAVLIIGGGFLAHAIQKNLNKRDIQQPVVIAKKEPPPKTTEASKLTGLEVPIGTNNRVVYSIQIENSPDARPQSALNQAGIVFEAIAEGGITRFNASFLDNQPDYIGPIRSVRPYYVDFVAPLDPVFVHAGGSGDGLAELRNVGLKDMDHGANGSTFWRVSERYAPHNLYSSTEKLNQASQSRGYNVSNSAGFSRKDKETPSPTITARLIDFSLSGFLYNPHFDYDQASNSYLRSQAGKPHTDLKSGAQLSPKVVVGIITDYSQNGIYSVYRMTGSGKVVIFQDGIATEGTWTKNSIKEQYKFTDPAGKEIKLNPGQTWVTMLAGPDRISYKAQ